MALSKRSQEGYLLIDHRACASGPTALHESATITCSHCHRVVVLNPGRTRVRGYCSKCDHYLCDACEAERTRTGECRPLNAVIDHLQETIVKNEQTRLRGGGAAPLILLPGD